VVPPTATRIPARTTWPTLTGAGGTRTRTSRACTCAVPAAAERPAPRRLHRRRPPLRPLPRRPRHKRPCTTTTGSSRSPQTARPLLSPAPTKTWASGPSVA
jgi:hypothetical protein